MEARAAQPPPPRFYKLYENGSDQGPRPPEPVQEGQFQQFGTLYETSDGIPQLNVEPLVKTESGGQQPSLKQAMKALNRETLFCFIDLIDSLVKRPSEASNKVENLRVLLLNLGYATNLIRPLQARANIQHQLEKDLKTAQNVSEEFLKSVGDTLQDLTSLCSSQKKEDT